MAMLFMDGFDYIAQNNNIIKWDNNTNSTPVTGVYGKGKAMPMSSTALTKTLASNLTTGMDGFHVFLTAIGTLVLFRFFDSGSLQVDLRMDATGHLFFTRNGTTIGSTSTVQLQPNNYYWIEMQVTISTTVGVANLYINNVSALAGSSLNTQNTANAFFNQIQIASNSAVTVDSFHCWDSTAGDVTAFPYGEHIIDTRLANAVGTNSAWTKQGTSHPSNFQYVNEANEDADTTYVTDTPGVLPLIDSYGFPALLESTGTIGTVAINTVDRIDDVGPHTMDHYTLSGGVVGLSAAISPSSTYNNHQTFRGTDPNTSAAWTVANLNAAEFGYKALT